jgi:hypothetical protein
MKAVLRTFERVAHFYYEGFINMSAWGKKVWVIIIIKLFIIFLILRIFFFPDFLGRNFKTDDERSVYIRNQLINTK